MIHLPNRSYLRIREVAEYFGVCTRTVERWAEKGDLLAIKVKGATRINRDSVIRMEVEGVFKKVRKIN